MRILCQGHDRRAGKARSRFLNLVEVAALYLVPRGYYRKRLLRWVDREYARAPAPHRVIPPD